LILDTRPIKEILPDNIPRADVWTGGFPCQDVSIEGKQGGIDGEQSGSWHEWFRLIRLVRPRIIVVENVPGLLGRGMGRVLGDLATLWGYRIEWDSIQASAFGAPHLRERVFIVAYANGEGLEGLRLLGKRPRKLPSWQGFSKQDWKEPHPDIFVEPDGISRRVDRFKVIGNSVLPQMAEWIAEMIGDAFPRARTHADFFAGIGGFSLGFTRAGFETVWANEINPYCIEVLGKNHVLRKVQKSW